MRRSDTRPALALTLAVSGVLAVAACTTTSKTAPSTSNRPLPASTASTATSSSPTSAQPTHAASTSRSVSRSSSRSPVDSAAARVLAAMSERERVGQLLMVDSPSGGIGDATRTAITKYHVGSVILDGTSHRGRSAVAGITARLRDLAPREAGLFIATDQEGGQVQRLQGPGFDPIPSAVSQGRQSPASLHADARVWGGQLRAAGVNVDLAPVLDVVPPGSTSNAPIGDLHREYGRTPGAVTRSGLAFAAGMTEAGVDVTAKHFPGLGRVVGNTDYSGGVRDLVTTRDDPYLAPFRAAVAQHIPFVMMSLAVYTKIDAGNPAAFSPAIVTGMLRGDLDYRGVVISDDVGVSAQVSQYSPGQRAVRFVAAGGDMVLTVDASQAGEMTDALTSRAKADPSFERLVDAAAFRVLQAKQARGLL